MCHLHAGKSLVCTVWPHTATNMPSFAQRLGIVFCLNRPCALYTVKVPFTCKNNTPSDSNPEAQCLTDAVLSVASPKFSPSRDKLVFLSHDAAAKSGVHCATAKLMYIPWSTGLWQQTICACLCGISVFVCVCICSSIWSGAMLV